jgi:putative FmdB family regulatory protein
MPIYEYRCRACAACFDSLQSIANRDAPCRVKCLKCGKKKMERSISTPVMGVDATLGPGSDFKNLMRKMERGTGRSGKENLQRAASLRGRKYGAQ